MVAMQYLKKSSLFSLSSQADMFRGPIKAVNSHKLLIYMSLLLSFILILLTRKIITEHQNTTIKRTVKLSENYLLNTDIDSTPPTYPEKLSEHKSQNNCKPQSSM